MTACTHNIVCNTGSSPNPPNPLKPLKPPMRPTRPPHIPLPLHRTFFTPTESQTGDMRFRKQETAPNAERPSWFHEPHFDPISPKKKASPKKKNFKYRSGKKWSVGVFVDAQNVPMDVWGSVVKCLETTRTDYHVYTRVYGNNQQVPVDMDVDFVHVTCKKKNAADFMMLSDIYYHLYRLHDIDEYIIVSRDTDFYQVVRDIIVHQRKVVLLPPRPFILPRD